jgi:radical SAM protein with 4Fe4S-binding SPASM domain
MNTLSIFYHGVLSVVSGIVMNIQLKKPTYTLKACNWELTLKCTLNCLHCGSSAGAARRGELTLEECFTIADELVMLGCEEITFIGGEVFLFRGWEKLSRYLSDRNVHTNIVSNGYKINDSDISNIKYAKLINIGISIDGMEKSHNRIRGKKDAFTRIQKTLDILNDANITIGAITSLMTLNYPDLETLYAFLIRNNVKIWQLQLVNPMGNMSKNNDLLINPENIPDITSFIKDKNRNKNIMIIAADSIGYFDDNESYIRGTNSPLCCWGGCLAGTHSIFIDSVGNVKGCGALYSDVFIEGNVRRSKLSEIWNSSKSFLYNRSFDKKLLKGKCKKCDFNETCKGGCRASNYFTSKSLYQSSYCSYMIQE